MNETEIEIGGKKRILKATFQNLVDIEKALKVSIMAFITPLATSGMFQPTYEQASHIIYHGLNGNADNRMELKHIQNELVEKGIRDYIPVIAEFLVGSLQGTKKKTEVEAENSLSQ
jgi:hypothetical protein